MCDYTLCEKCGGVKQVYDNRTGDCLNMCECNEPDYKDNLAFEPEMTMQDVFDVAVEKYDWRVVSYKQGWIYKENIFITSYGRILTECWHCDRENVIADDLPPKQVLMIIEGLM